MPSYFPTGVHLDTGLVSFTCLLMFLTKSKAREFRPLDIVSRQPNCQNVTSTESRPQTPEVIGTAGKSVKRQSKGKKENKQAKKTPKKKTPPKLQNPDSVYYD